MDKFVIFLLLLTLISGYAKAQDNPTMGPNVQSNQSLGMAFRLQDRVHANIKRALHGIDSIKPDTMYRFRVKIKVTYPGELEEIVFTRGLSTTMQDAILEAFENDPDAWVDVYQMEVGSRDIVINVPVFYYHATNEQSLRKAKQQFKKYPYKSKYTSDNRASNVSHVLLLAAVVDLEKADVN